MDPYAYQPSQFPRSGNLTNINRINGFCLLTFWDKKCLKHLTHKWTNFQNSHLYVWMKKVQECSVLMQTAEMEIPPWRSNLTLLLGFSSSSPGSGLHQKSLLGTFFRIFWLFKGVVHNFFFFWKILYFGIWWGVVQLILVWGVWKPPKLKKMV